MQEEDEQLHTLRRQLLTLRREKEIVTAALNRIHESHGWKALVAYYGLRNLLLPPGSRRKALAQIVFHALVDGKNTLSNAREKARISWDDISHKTSRKPLPAKPAGIAACTIVSKNYIAFARTLFDSFRRFHPDIPFYVLLVDRVDGCFDPAREGFQVVTIDELAIPDLDSVCFKYDILELNTAVKPYFLSYLFDKYQLGKLTFFDPDILITGKLDDLYGLLNEHSIVLVPHLTAPIDDDRKPTELDILLAGTYNLGFIGLARNPELQTFLSWWKKRVYDGCFMAPERAMHVDQKWIDLVPGLFDRVLILKHPGYDVAYWNLHSRSISFLDGQVVVNGGPCYFFHFSGVDPLDVSKISRHQDRFAMRDLGEGERLFEEYGDLVLANGHQEAIDWPYAFGSFDNGVPIPEIVRRMYHALGAERNGFGNPFSTHAPRNFFDWLNEAIEVDSARCGTMTRLWHEVYRARPDVQQAFPDVFDRDREAFFRWIASNGKHEQSIDDRLVPAIPSFILEEAPGTVRPFGVNLAGYLRSEKGVGEAGRAAVRALEAGSIPYALNEVVDPASINEVTLSSMFSDHNPYSVNLIHVNADQVPVFVNRKGHAYFRGRYNIGCWFWELSQFPEDWYSSFDSFDELWAPTSFIQDALSRVSPIPVVKMPLALAPELEVVQSLTRESFGLPASSFIVLSVFDFASVLERKNPVGLIKAFNRAFCGNDNALLVLKVTQLDQFPAEAEALKRASSATNVRIIDRNFTRLEMNTLLSVCDCYASLHRSEGYGLPIAEAMTLGKPVVVTAYSGNMDFTTATNSLLVRYKLVEADRDHGPYRKGSVWADPDLDHAADLLRYARDNANLVRAIGSIAREDMRRLFHPGVVAKQMRQRLVRIGAAADAECLNGAA